MHCAEGCTLEHGKPHCTSQAAVQVHSSWVHLLACCASCDQQEHRILRLLTGLSIPLTAAVSRSGRVPRQAEPLVLGPQRPVVRVTKAPGQSLGQVF